MPDGSRADQSAIVVGVGARQGVGGALAHRLSREGMHVFIAGRTADRLEALAKELRADGGVVTPVVTDTTSEEAVIALFDHVEKNGPPLELVAFNAGNNLWGSLLEMEADFFEDIWRVACFGGFLVGREAARRLVPIGRGSILFTGASASLRGKAQFAAFASAKAGLRMVVQSLAREVGPQGIHVAHVVIDGAVNGEVVKNKVPGIEDRFGSEGMLNVDAIAETFWQLHLQHPTAWTQELDLRPFKENW